jgi:phosphatidylethanolamine/phosphatidyl-N-methylethanolamine N-methyltransferase
MVAAPSTTTVVESMSSTPSDPTLFFRLWLKDPFKIGAIAPSSPDLARAMASLVPDSQHYPIVELGGGTGVITQALLERGIPPQKLIVVERDPTLHDLLQKRFPSVNVVQGDAAHLGALLHPHGISKVSTIVSGLPLLVFRKSVQQEIIAAAFAVMERGAPFIQFTYGPFSPLPRKELGLVGRVRKRVLNNLPPASIWVYQRSTETRAAA